MAVGSVNYPHPVTVNGFSCRNCSDVDLAKKHVDPAHPKSGPNNSDAAHDPSRGSTDPAKVEAARKTGEAAITQVVGYSMAGYRTAAVNPGQAFSLAG